MVRNRPMEQSKLMRFVARSDEALRIFHESTPKRKKFVRPAFNSSEVQERMMRIGFEARVLNVVSEDGLFELAIATLQDDFVRASALIE